MENEEEIPVPDDSLADLTDEEQVAIIEDTHNPPDPDDPGVPNDDRS